MEITSVKRAITCFITLASSSAVLSSCGGGAESTGNELDIGFHTKAPESVTIQPQLLSNYNGQTAAHLKELRTKTVNQNAKLLKGPYTPSPSVFQIDDKASWWSLKGYLFRSTNPTEGQSRESAYFGNPYILVVPEWYAGSTHYAQNRFKSEADFANVFPTYYPPSSVKIFPKDKKEEIVYNIMPHYNMIKSMMNGVWPISEMAFNLNAYNARDFGYKYIYVDAGKSKNISKYSSDVIPIDQGIALRTRHSCAPQCNDQASDRDELMGFKLKDVPAQAHILLWKEKPSSYVAPADMNVDLIINAN